MQFLRDSLHDDDVHLFGELVVVDESVDEGRDVIALPDDEAGVVLAEADVDIDCGQNRFVRHISVNYNSYPQPGCP
jgi:hypothetical protein